MLKLCYKEQGKVTREKTNYRIYSRISRGFKEIFLIKNWVGLQI
jgi:hypothetical protein